MNWSLPPWLRLCARSLIELSSDCSIIMTCSSPPAPPVTAASSSGSIGGSSSCLDMTGSLVDCAVDSRQHGTCHANSTALRHLARLQQGLGSHLVTLGRQYDAGVDLDVYFKRIGWTGPRTASPDV